MTPDTAFLSLVQWLSPAFPTGAFSCSHGLEWAITAGDVTDTATLEGWIADVLRHGAGRADAVLLAHALKPGADLDGLGDLARALAASSERLRETEDQGAAFAATAGALLGVDLPPRPLPVAVGQAAQRLTEPGRGLPPAQVLALYLHGFAANLVSAAVRFVPLGQTEGQQVLAALHPQIAEIADEAAVAPLDSIGSAAFRADMAAMLHETMDVRIFRT